MTITNGYCTLAQLQDETGVTAAAEATKMELAIAAASRQIDGYCDRRFWQDANVVARQYWPDDSRLLYVDDISTATGLIVATDDGDNGTFSTALTITTDFILLEPNAAVRVPAWPYEAIRIVNSGYGFPMSNGGRPGVQITAKFGWPAVPDDVTKACIIQSLQLWKSKDALFGGLSFGDSGFMRVQGALNPLAAALVAAYRKPPIG